MNQIYKSNSDEVRLSILKVLTYFRIFSHPLKLQEIALLSNVSEKIAEQSLQVLIADEIVYCFDRHFTTCKEVAQFAEQRIVKEAEAEKYFAKLKKYARLLSTFPFVRGIAVSGSLSKGVMNPDGDIDYFIITKPGRLWICRTSMVLFKKLFLFNSKKYFCVNYFVDSKNLQIRDENIFTATEFIHLLPVFEKDGVLADFVFQNGWVNKFYQRMPDWNKRYMVKGNSRVRSLLEFFLQLSVFNPIERVCHRLTILYWRKKFSTFKKEKFDLTMRSTQGISKHHPSDFQTKVLKEFQEEISKIHSVTLAEI